MRKLILATPLLLLTACNSGGQNAVSNVISAGQSLLTAATQTMNNVCASAPQTLAPVASNTTTGATINNLLSWLGGVCGKGVATGQVISAAANDPNGIQNTANWAFGIINSLKGLGL